MPEDYSFSDFFEEYAFMQGGMKKDITDKQIYDAAEDAYNFTRNRVGVK